MEYRTLPLRVEANWIELRDQIAPFGSGPGDALLTRLRSLGCKFVVIETKYLDRDFSEEYSYFYSKLFKSYPKQCVRYHFFNKDLSFIFRNASISDISKNFADEAPDTYLGFVVLRSLSQSVIGRTVLKAPVSPHQRRSHLLVRGNYSVHVMGAELEVSGIPFIQQDARIGACAHAVIWMAARHFHIKHKHTWYSTPEIAEAAASPTDAILSASLPAGSGGLSTDNMLRALRAIGRRPLMYAARIEPSTKKPIWPTDLNPVEIINRYVDSAIPVIVGLLPWEKGQQSAHAVLAVGHTLKTFHTKPSLSPLASRSIFCDAFLVNDDQRGTGLRMALDPASSMGQTPYNISDHVYFVMVPLPNKVFVKAEVAEAIAWERLKGYIKNLTAIRVQHRNEIFGSEHQTSEVFRRFSQNEIVCRTYLTMGWKYKQRIVNNSVVDQLKENILGQDLPRYVWVTEFGFFDDLNRDDAADRRIFSHVVTDATSYASAHTIHETTLLFHAPGIFWLWNEELHPDDGKYGMTAIPIPNDQKYSPRYRSD